MTEAKLNETINRYSGSIGKLVFKKYKGRTIVARKGVSSKPPTEGQRSHVVTSIKALRHALAPSARTGVRRHAVQVRLFQVHSSSPQRTSPATGAGAVVAGLNA